MQQTRELERLFKGLGDLNRLRILNLLLHGELCVCDIQYVLGASQPNASRHLIYLKNSGLVLHRRQGQRMYYRLMDPGNGALREILHCLKKVFNGVDEFEADCRKLKKAMREGACTARQWRPVPHSQGRKPRTSTLHEHANAL